MATALHFLDDASAFECEAAVREVYGNIVVVDRTVYYPGIGVSAADVGELVRASGEVLPVAGGVWAGRDQSELGHVLRPHLSLPRVGERVTVRVDGKLRRLHMRTHTALHLVAVGFPYRIVGGLVRPGEGHIVFRVDQTAMSTTVLQNQLERLIAHGDPVSSEWLSRSDDIVDEREQDFIWPGRPDHVRAIKIGSFKAQPCDGLHVSNTREVGVVSVKGIFPLAGGRSRINISLLDKRPFPFSVTVPPRGRAGMQGRKTEAD